MIYNIESEVTTLVVLLLLVGHYFSKYRFPSLTNKIFGFFLVCALADIVLDLITAYTISFPEKIPEMLNMIIVTVFITLQYLLAAVFFVYVLCLTDNPKFLRKKVIVISTIPFFVFELFLITNFWHKQIFYFQNDVYVHGPAFSMQYIESVIYLGIIIVMAFVFNKKIEKKRSLRVLTICTIVGIGIAIQYVWPQYLVSGSAVVIGLFWMYLLQQNPAELLDNMTDVFNRSGFIKYMQMTFLQKERCNLIFFNIDKLKTINQTIGMTAGNEILKKVAGTIKSGVRGDLVFRLIGDNFAIVSKNSSAARNNLNFLRSLFKQSLHINGVDIKISATICVAFEMKWNYAASEFPVVMENIMSMVKDLGPGTVFYINDEILKIEEKEVKIERALRAAITEEKIDIVLQPIYSTEKKKLVAAEVLARFNHKDVGQVPPSVFIPLAERNGLITSLGEVIRGKVFKLVRDENLEDIDILRNISINLSGVEVMQDNIAERIKRDLLKYNITGEKISFEITETAMMKSEEKAVALIESLNKQGMRVALDDFGTGYANFNQILMFPFSAIKIDKSMMSESFINEKKRKIFQCVVSLIKDVNMSVIVEGVEEEEQAKALEEQKIDYLQGYYYSKPLSTNEFVELIRKEDN